MSSSDGDIDSELTDESDFQARGPIKHIFGENTEIIESVERQLQPKSHQPSSPRRKSSRYRAPPTVAPSIAAVPTIASLLPPSPLKPTKLVLTYTTRENVPMKKRSRPTAEIKSLQPAKRSRPSKTPPTIIIDGTSTERSSPAAQPQDPIPHTTAKRKRTNAATAPMTATKEPLAVQHPSTSASSKSTSSRSATHSRTNSAADSRASADRVQAKPSTVGELKDPLLPLPPAKVSRTSSTTNVRATRNNVPPKRPSWADSTSDDFDVLRFLKSDEFLCPDPLAQLPQPSYTYIDSQGRLKDPHKYATAAPPRSKAQPEHPKVTAHRKNGTLTSMNQLYYQDMPKHRVLPLAGIIRAPDPRDEIFYPEDYGVEHSPGAGFRGSNSMFPYLSNDQINILTIEKHQQEDNFYARPSIKLIIPDHIKAILVDDWENVTKNQQLVPIPATHTVESILDDYVQFEAPKRVKGSSQADILEEVVAGLKEYFEKCLGRILLYRFERTQYLEAREGWAEKTGDFAGKNAITTYGAEHFCRLLVSLPELIAQTNMDQQSVARLREELSKLTNWLGKEVNMPKYFVSEYETPSQAYVEKARNF